MNAFFTEKLESWYASHRRELPWRDTADAYRIWISEIILQQTRVAQGHDYYVRFVERFPDVVTLAEASEDEVLLLWQGLGYYSRARNLHKAAQMVCREYGGRLPGTFAELRRLPGVGDYTAAAIASFAYGEATAVLDGNVYRVLSRHLGIDTPIDTTKGQREFRMLADEMLDRRQPALYNQAIMDFGALVCMPHALCEECPLCESCQAFREGRVENLPVKSRTTQVKPLHLIYIYARAQGHLLLRRRGRQDIWKGLYEPLTQMPPGTEESLPSPVLLREGVKHQLTHRSIQADFYLWELPSCESLPSAWLQEEGYRWVKEEERDDLATSRLVQELYKMVNKGPEYLGD